MEDSELIELAKNASKYSYSPYSKFMVGAALECEDGKIYTGCNIENKGIQSICAERVAFAKAISEGKCEFKKIAIVGRKENQDFQQTLPCGYCREFISEFVDKNFKIIIIKENKVKEYTIEELLPESFKL